MSVVIALQSAITFLVNKKDYAPGLLWLTLLVIALVWPPAIWRHNSDRRPPRWARRAAHKHYRHAMKPRCCYIRVRRKPPSLAQQALIHCMNLLQDQVICICRSLDRMWNRAPYVSPYAPNDWRHFRAGQHACAPPSPPSGFRH